MYKFETKKETLGLILFVVGLLYLLIATYYGLTRTGLWYDELCTQATLNMPLNQMIERMISDVHPPGYYFGLRLLKKIGYILGFMDLETLGVLFSLIPMYLLFILSGTKIRKNFGILTSGLFSLCIISMPMLMKYATEVRMYSWGLFFTTICFVYLWEIKNNSNFKNWSLFTIFAICSAYTHYFTAVTAGVMYAIIFIYVFKDRIELKKWFLSTIIAILAYSSWIPYAFSQVAKVSKDYWIQPITIQTIKEYFYFMFNPMTEIKANNIGWEVISPKFEILGLILMITLIAVLIVYLINKNKLSEDMKEKNNFALLGWAIVALVPIIGVTISLIKTPIFHMRYLVPLLGITWLSFCILLESTYDKKRIFYPILIIILVIGAISTINYIDYTEQAYALELADKNMVLSELTDNCVIVTDDWRNKQIILSYIKNPTIYKNKSIVDAYEKAIKNDTTKNKDIFIISKKDNLDFDGLNITVISKQPFIYNCTLYKIEKN